MLYRFVSNASALLRIGLAPRARQKTRYPNPEPENPNLNPKSQKKNYLDRASRYPNFYSELRV
jgi:hypothetical protein